MQKRKPKTPLTSIRTGTGDGGETFFQGGMMSKDDALIDFVGDIDEACAFLGKLETPGIDKYQTMLFELAAMTHSPNALTEFNENLKAYVITIVKYIEVAIQKEGLTELRGFIIPTPINADAMIARAVIRRAERSAVRAGLDWAVPLLNVFSDYLFVISWKLDATNQWTGFKPVSKEESDV